MQFKTITYTYGRQYKNLMVTTNQTTESHKGKKKASDLTKMGCEVSGILCTSLYIFI